MIHADPAIEAIMSASPFDIQDAGVLSEDEDDELQAPHQLRVVYAVGESHKVCFHVFCTAIPVHRCC